MLLHTQECSWIVVDLV